MKNENRTINRRPLARSAHRAARLRPAQRNLLRRWVAETKRGAAALKRAQKIMGELIRAGIPLNTPLALSKRRVAVIQDRFADGNIVAWAPKSFNRYKVTIVWRKRHESSHAHINSVEADAE